MEIAYIKCGDYYIPDLTLPEEPRPIGKWGRMHREYLKATHPITYTNLILSGKLWTYLADLNEQAQLRLDTLVFDLKAMTLSCVYRIHIGAQFGARVLELRPGRTPA